MGASPWSYTAKHTPYDACMNEQTLVTVVMDAVVVAGVVVGVGIGGLNEASCHGKRLPPRVATPALTLSGRQSQRITTPGTQKLYNGVVQ